MKGETLGQYLKRIRLERGYESQRQLALKSGVHNSTIALIERDDVVPSPEVLRKLAKALRVDFITLMVRAGHIKPQEEASARQDRNKVITSEELEVLQRIIEKYKDLI